MFDFTMDMDLDDVVVEHMLHGRGGAVHRWLKRKGVQMELGAMHEVLPHTKTGRLIRSLYHDIERSPLGWRLSVGAKALHAFVHHEGTRPHTIIGGVGHELVFVERGKVIRKKVVHHPGTKPNRYLSSQLKHLLTP